MERLFNSAKEFCLNHGFDRTYWVGFSGGLDSSVLLHLLANVRSLYPIRLRAIHIHHGLSPNADQWAAHCEALCHEFAIDLVQRHVSVKFSAGESPEEMAREVRYQAFYELMAPNDILLTAHHQDDQAETVLLQLLRGAGPKGLAAMADYVSFKQHCYLGRPLLNFSRQTLQEYADFHHLHWVNDESNSNINFTRNFIRHEVITLLKSRWPNVTTALARVADHCAETQALLEYYSQQDLDLCLGSQKNTLSVKKLLELNPARQRQVLRLWIKKNNFPLPSTVKIQHLLHDVLTARTDKSPHVIWGDVEVRRYRDDIYVMPLLKPCHSDEDFDWDLSQPLVMPGRGELRAEPVLGQGLRADIQSVTVKFRHGGESVKLPGRSHHHSLKKLFQSWGIPPWQRDRMPLIFVGNELAAVPGYFMAETFAANELEMGLSLVLVSEMTPCH